MRESAQWWLYFSAEWVDEHITRHRIDWLCDWVIHRSPAGGASLKGSTRL